MTEALNDRLQALTVDLGVPAQVSDQITSLLASYPEAAAAAAGLAVGDSAPPFTLPDPVGAPVSLDDLLADGPVVLSFYRGEWCPYCNLALRAWQDRLDELAALGGKFAAVTPQRPTDAMTLTEKHALGFPVLSDVDQAVIRAYRLRYDVPDGLRELYAGGFGIDLAALNGDGSWTLTIPATLVIGEDRIVRYAYVDVDYRNRAEPDDVLAAVREARS